MDKYEHVSSIIDMWTKYGATVLFYENLKKSYTIHIRSRSGGTCQTDMHLKLFK